MDGQPTPVDLSTVAGAGGVVWSVSPPGLHANLVVLEAGAGIGDSRNDALDVLLVVLAGEATVTVDGTPAELRASSALLVPRRATRRIVAGPAGVRYLSVHPTRSLSVAPGRPS